MGFLLTALGWLAQNFIGALVGKAADHAVQQFGEQRGVEDDLKKLQDSLANSRLIISSIESLRIKDEGLQQKLKELLIRLKDAAYDADDLLDEFLYRVLKQQIEPQGDEAGNQASSSSTPPPSKKIKTSVSSFASGLFGKRDDDDDMLRMREIKGRLDNLSAALKVYSLPGSDDTGKMQMASPMSRSTSSFSTESQVFGRDKELKELKDLLLKPEDISELNKRGVSVLTIVGIGGVGKTTLAQQVFNDKSVEQYFEHRIWVCVSENFCAERLTKEIIEYATKEKCDLTSFAALQLVLREKITSRRFLLVLDDVWNEDRHKWESLCAPLWSGIPGSKILVTTRSIKIADMVGDVDVIHLKGLDEENFWAFFKKCAFGSSDSGVHHPHLETIAKKMTCKLKGLPLAAKTLGGLLSMKLDEQYWKNILDSEIWQLPQEENGVMPVLQLSYQYLPLHLKPCFAFCSLFPKDYNFYESRLIRHWMAEGFIVPTGSTRMEELGSNYFYELVTRSFFQKSPNDSYIMHDLIHDLAQLISACDSYRVEHGKPHEIPIMIRHLSVHKEEDMQTRSLTEFAHYNKLRTLMFILHDRQSFLFDCGLLKRLKSIRVLVLVDCAITELPKNIGELIHLHYLDISNNYCIQKLPESLCDLYNLQTFIFTNCSALQNLPQGMRKLINLRQLQGRDKVLSEIIEVGKLTSLQSLSAFKVLKDHGHKLSELNSLNQLRGSLHITNLENVENKEEANTASLKSKEYLDTLCLEWTSTQDSSLDINLHVLEEVLEGLQPHHNLRYLRIVGYNGAKPPRWLNEEAFSRLESVAFINCRWNDLSVLGQLSQIKHLVLKGIPVQTTNLHRLFDPTTCKFFSRLEGLTMIDMNLLEDLPNQLGQFPCLENLHIESLPGVKMISNGLIVSMEQGRCFPRLRILGFHKMPSWEEFCCSNDTNLFPCLHELWISNCKMLRSLPPLPPALKHLHLRAVGLIDCPGFQKVIDGYGSVINSESLSSLFIKECPNLRSVGQGLLAQHLRDIDICKCDELLWMPLVRLQELTSLTSLSISECPKLMSMTQDADINLLLPPSIQSLRLYDCGKLHKSLPGCLHNLTSLSELTIGNCPNLISLPVESAIHLANLTIKNCIELRSIEGLRVQSLNSFKIERCPKVLLSEGEAQAESSSLQNLEIDDTTFINQSPIRNSLASIKSLTISWSSQTVMFEGMDQQESLQSLTSLYELTFSDCMNLQSLPTKLYTLTSLRILTIRRCPQIQSQPEKGLPPFLTGLHFSGCHLALMEQLKKHLTAMKKSGRYRARTIRTLQERYASKSVIHI